MVSRKALTLEISKHLSFFRSYKSLLEKEKKFKTLLNENVPKKRKKLDGNVEKKVKVSAICGLCFSVFY